LLKFSKRGSWILNYWTIMPQKLSNFYFLR
jgi:hypothetical protein